MSYILFFIAGGLLGAVALGWWIWRKGGEAIAQIFDGFLNLR